MNVGDLLTFKSATRDGCRKATRVITGFDEQGRPLVRYNGWHGFIVRKDEIICVAKAA